MEKKFDFKTIAIACLLFFGFVFLLFYKFSSADDSLTHYKTALEIFDSQQSFDDFKATLPDKILPDDYSESESMVNMLYTLACFCMGDYIGVGEGLVTELSGQITGDPLFLQHFVFDYDSLCWVFDSETDDFIKSKLDSIIYVTPEPGANEVAVGAWYYVPYSSGYYPHPYNSSREVEIKFSSESSSSCFMTVLQNGSTVVASYEYQAVVVRTEYNFIKPSGPTISLGSTNLICSSSYHGSETVGYYTSGSFGGTHFPQVPTNLRYSTVDSALADLFGQSTLTPSGGEPYLIDGVSIRNNDFFVKPLSYPASVLVDYPNLITYPDYDPDDTRLTFDYTYTMEVPFWLKNPTTEPTSYELPTDYDFGNIEFEYEADPSYLAGAGIVQDVFEVLPASLQGLIALFGAGSLAFIFLRR